MRCRDTAQPLGVVTEYKPPQPVLQKIVITKVMNTLCMFPLSAFSFLPIIDQ